MRLSKLTVIYQLAKYKNSFKDRHNKDRPSQTKQSLVQISRPEGQTHHHSKLACITPLPAFLRSLGVGWLPQ